MWEMIMKNDLPVLSVDLGGTKILAALVDGDKVSFKDNSLTGAVDGPEFVIDRLCATISRVLDKSGRDQSGISGISVAAAGGIDVASGIVTLSPSLPGWRNIPLVAEIRKRFSKTTVYIIHDANASALGELTYGAGRGTKNMIFLTVSTGIGGGIIINGKEYHGADGAAGEIGHMTIDVNGPKCTCGNTGCLEVLASGTAMARYAVERLREGKSSLLTSLADGKLECITAREIEQAAKNGDDLANQVIDRAAGYLGIGLVNVINIFNPEAVVIGGGISNLGERILAPARRVVKERAFPISAKTARIVRAELGEESGIIGAAVYAAMTDK